MRVIPQGRSFISRLLDMASSVSQLHDLISLDDGCCSDLRFWSHLLECWNGVSFFYDDLVHSSDSMLFFMFFFCYTFIVTYFHVSIAYLTQSGYSVESASDSPTSTSV